MKKWAILAGTVFEVRPDINEQKDAVYVELFDTELAAVHRCHRNVQKQRIHLQREEEALLARMQRITTSDMVRLAQEQNTILARMNDEMSRHLTRVNPTG